MNDNFFPAAQQHFFGCTCRRLFAARVRRKTFQFPGWAEAVWKLAWFLDDEDVSVDFVEARGFGVILTPYAPERVVSALLWRFLRYDLS